MDKDINMVKTLQKSVFINIIASLGYIGILVPIVLVLLSTITSLLNLPEVLFYIPLVFNIPFLLFFPLYAVIIIIASSIAALSEIKKTKTNGYIINIPDKVINSKLYNIVFWIGLLLTPLMCIAGIYAFILIIT